MLADRSGTRVLFSAVLPAKQPTANGKPGPSTSRPTMICGSARRSFRQDLILVSEVGNLQEFH